MPAIKMTRDAREYIQGLQPKQAKQVAVKIFSLGENPRPNDHIAMKDSPQGYLRVDIGEFRIIYRLDGDTVIVAAVGKRNDDEVYRRFGRG